MILLISGLHIMKITGLGKTDKGIVRENNEDNIYVDGQYVSDTSVASSTFYVDDSRDCHTLAVCDGVGGASYGELASLSVVKTLQQCELNDDFDAFSWVEKFNSAVLAEKTLRETNEMGSTIALARFEEDTLFYVNVGDSRIYYYNGDDLEQLSKDHTRIQVMRDAGILNEALSSKYEHQLTQYIGITEDEFIVEPSVGNKKLQAGDVIVLCSDGVTDVLSHSDLLEILKINQNLEPEELLNKIFDKAIEKKTKDNISIIVAKVK